MNVYITKLVLKRDKYGDLNTVEILEIEKYTPKTNINKLSLLTTNGLLLIESSPKIVDSYDNVFSEIVILIDLNAKRFNSAPLIKTTILSHLRESQLNLILNK